MEIFDGLRDGEFVVIAGVNQISDGEEVMLLPENRE